MGATAMNLLLTSWTYLGEWNTFEYWQSPVGVCPDGVQIFRRKPCADNYFCADATGKPSALRHEGSLAWFETYVAATLPV